MARSVKPWKGKTDDTPVPPRVKDIRGCRFGCLTVVRFSGYTEGRRTRIPAWEALCDCGSIKVFAGADLSFGKVISCGCKNPSAMKDLQGKSFGKWTVLQLAPRTSVRLQWLCRCECGTERPVAAIHLMRGKSRSCGCSMPKGSDSPQFKHGKRGLYSTWCNMIQRCENPSNGQYSDYGGRGITICPEWRSDFLRFERDMGPKPSPTHTVDRRDNSKGYNPDNCRWATRTEQSRNRRGRHLVTVHGQTMPLSEAVEKYGGNYGTVKWRLHQGQSIEEALKL